MTREKEKEFIRANYERLSDEELGEKLRMHPEAVRYHRRQMKLYRKNNIRIPQERVAIEQKLRKDTEEKKADKSTISFLINEKERLERELEAALSFQKPLKTHAIRRSHGKKGEATIIALLSDWHVEEEVKPGQVNGVNRYNLEIARERADHFFRTLLRLIEIEQKDSKVDELVLALIGDFITGEIHPDAKRFLDPTEAIMFAMELLVSGIDFLLENSKLHITAVCHSGNHGRFTKEQMHASELGHSLEWLMYQTLALRYRNNKRLTFIIPEGYHSYLRVYDWTVRFHHGHNVNYGGGIGGITIPVNKAIAKWNTLKWADLDCFGHFHTAFDGGDFVSNGSMIGYGAYGLAVKGRYQPPIQMMFGIHSKHGRYVTRQIKFNV